MPTARVPAKYVVALAALLAAKLLLLALVGPRWMNDTVGYVAYADRIAGDLRWLHDAGLAESARPVTAHRAIGYPLVIAAARALTGDAWPWAVCVLQSAASLAGTAAVWAMVRRWTPSVLAADAAALLHAAGLQWAYDATLLTDSLHATAYLVAVAFLVRAAAEPPAPGPRRVAAAGLLVACAFLLREVNWPLALALAPAAWIALRGGGAARTTLRALVFFAPLLAAAAALTAWNVHRTGRAFVTTGAQTAVLVGLVDSQAHGAPVFGGERASPLDAAFAAVGGVRSWEDVEGIQETLHRDHGLQSPEIAAAVSGRFFDVWRESPAAMARQAWRRARWSALPSHVVDPAEPAKHLATRTEPADARLVPGTEAAGPARLPPRDAPSLPRWLELVWIGVSCALFWAFLLGPLAEAARWAVRRAAPAPGWQVRWALTAWYVAVVAAYAAVRIERRYLLPATAVALALGIAQTARAVAAIRVRRAAPPA
jgi:hypothetical protein